MKPILPLHDSVATCGAACKQAHAVAKAKLGIGGQVSEFFTKTFNTADWPPRWHCGSWTDFHGWLYILSDLGIWAAYFAIPFLLLQLVRKRKDLPFHKIFLLFVAFILLCGLTHLMDAIIFWWPAYRLSALLRFATAVVSMFTVYALYRIIPMAFNLRTVGELEAEIKKRRVVEEKLAESEFLLSEAGRISRVGAWESDLQRASRIWSKTVYDIFELPYNFDLMAYRPEDYFAEPWLGNVENAVKTAITDGTKWDLELQATTAKGNMLWVRSTGEALYDDAGRMIKLRGIFMDIERYKINEIALNKSLELTSQNNQQLKNFTHILSHNIRNHASNMALISSLIDLDKLDDTNAELFDKIKNVSGALNTTLEDLSEAIKIKNSVIESEELEFSVITGKAIEIFASDIEVNHAKIETEYAVTKVNFPRIYLESILVNLISNAIKYRKDDVDLRVNLTTYKDKDGRTVLSCRDNGLGIDLKLHGKKIFGLYKTFHDRKDAHGVGLFLMKSQIESQGGQIEVESTPGKGSNFKIIFND